MISTNLHWEVIMRMIVLVDVTDCLLDHGKKWSECSQTGEIHNMLQSWSIFQRSFDQAIRREKWHHWSCCISLDFDYGWNGFSGGVTLKKVYIICSLFQNRELNRWRLKVRKFQNECMKSLHCPKYERKN